MRGGYPVQRGGPRPLRTAIPDLQGRRPLSFPANDVRPSALTAPEVELLQQTETVIARRALVSELGGMVLTGLTWGGYLILAVGVAEVAYAIYNSPGETTTLPRDPSNAQDMALTWDPAKFIVDTTSWPSSMTFDNSDTRWYTYPSTDTGLSATVWTDHDAQSIGYTNGYAYIPGNEPWMTQRTPIDLQANGLQVGEWAERIQRGVDNGYSPPRPGGWPMEEVHLKPGVAAGTAPDWANAPRTVTTPGETRVFPVPVEDPVRRSWEDIPTQPRHPLTEVGPVAPPPGLPIEFIPPPFEVVAGPNPGGRPRPRPITRPGPFGVNVPVNPRRPPRKREKEKKVKIRRGNIVQALYHIADWSSESLDLLNALWKQLPDSCKTGFKYLPTHHARGEDGRFHPSDYKWVKKWYANHNEKVADLYRCWDHLTAETVLQTWRDLDLGDRIAASGGRLAKKAAELRGDDRSLLVGPWDSAAYQALQELRTKRHMEKVAALKEARAVHHAMAKASRRTRRTQAQFRRTQKMLDAINRRHVRQAWNKQRRRARRHAWWSAHHVHKQVRIGPRHRKHKQKKKAA